MPLAGQGFVLTCRRSTHDVISACNICRPQGALYRRVHRRRLEPESEFDVDIYTIIFLALAVFIFLRLRNVLGQRTGNERPPYDRAARNVVQGAPDSNVVPMPGTVIDQTPMAPTADVAPPTDHWKGIAEPGTPLAQSLDAIAAQVKDGIREAGGTPMEFNTIAISDGITMGTAGMRVCQWRSPFAEGPALGGGL